MNKKILCVINDDLLKEKAKEYFGNTICFDDDSSRDFDAVFIVESGNKEMDKSAVSRWVGHNHLRYIKKEKNKMLEALVQKINYYKTSNVEIEKKFLIKPIPVEFLKKTSNCCMVEIEQAYLKGHGGENCRIRKRCFKDSTQYYLTTKKQISTVKREENEEEISKDVYSNLINKKAEDTEIIRKKRYCIMENYTYFEIDVFPFMESYMLLEVELDNEMDNFTLPSYIEVVKDVTENRDFTNFFMAKKIKTDENFYNNL